MLWGSLVLASAVALSQVWANDVSSGVDSQSPTLDASKDHVLRVAQVTSASQSAASSQKDVMTEIVVTAQKRTERLQDVPISVTALNSTQLTELGVTSTKDLEFVVPSLVTNELAGWNQTFMRGVGTDIQNPGAEPGVPTYIDGVYNPFIISPLTGLMGIDRTEVLMGPQGTLYGRNAIGGTINIVTLTPTQNFDAGRRQLPTATSAGKSCLDMSPAGCRRTSRSASVRRARTEILYYYSPHRDRP